MAGQFRPGSAFREFYFDETGDTNATSPENATAGGWGSIMKLTQRPILTPYTVIKPAENIFTEVNSASAPLAKQTARQNFSREDLANMWLLKGNLAQRQGLGSHGEEVKAFVVRSPGATVSEPQLVAWCSITCWPNR